MFKLITCNIALAAFILSANAFVFAQKEIKLPSKLEDGFVLQFNAPFDRILIDTDEKGMPNRLASEIFITAQTKILNHKGKPLAPNLIRPGMKVEIKLDAAMPTPTAASLKLRTNPDEWEMEVDGYLDKIDDERAFVDGQAVALAPNASLVGEKDWKGKSFNSFKDIALGSLVDLKGFRSAGGVVLIKQGKVRPNNQKEIERRLIQVVQQGLVVPPAGQTGAGVKIGEKIYKLVDNLEVNTFVNVVGNRVAPRYMRNLPADDPGNILFRFYVIEDDTPNAFAFADGSVFVNTGLLKRLENEAQLAVVIGHEIAHVTNEHARRTIETQQNQALWLGLAGAVAGGQLGVLVAQVGAGLLANKFTRDLEDQADRVGLYYAWEAGYDVREAPKMWLRMLGSYRETAVDTLLYSDHPSMLSRYRNTNRMMAFNYAASDFSESEIGRERYMDAVGVYFGWVQPKPKKIIPQPTPTTKNTKPTTKNTKPVTQPKTRPLVKKTQPVISAAAIQQKKINSVLSFVVNEVNKPDAHTKEDVYVSIILEGFDYTVSLKTGRVIKKIKSTEKSFSEEYAEIFVNTLNVRMKTTGQGSGWLLKQSGNTWMIVALAEGEYSCSNLNAVPQTVRQALDIECF